MGEPPHGTADSLFADLDEVLQRQLPPPTAQAHHKFNEGLVAEYQRTGDKRFATAILRANYRLVYVFARRFSRRFANDLELDDLISAGNTGLLDAMNRYEAGHGANFATYAALWIAQRIRREIATGGSRIRIPVHALEEVLRLIRAEDLGVPLRLVAGQGLGTASQMSPKRIQWLLHLRRVHASGGPSLDDTSHADGTESTLDALDPGKNPGTRAAAAYSDPFGAVATWDLRRRIQEALQLLPERLRTIVICRFGLDGNGIRTLQDLAAKYGMTRERIRQLEEKALARIEKHKSRFFDRETDLAE